MSPMISPDPEFYVIFVLPRSVEYGFRVEAIFTAESDAVTHADLMRKSGNYVHVVAPNKETMESVLDRLLQQKIGCLAAIGAKEIVLKIEEQ